MYQRELVYKIGDLEKTYIVEEYLNVLLYYAKVIDSNVSEKMYYLTRKKIEYLIDHNLSIIGLNSFEDMDAYFNINDLQTVIDFITNSLLPSLNAEAVTMWQKYGNVETLINLVNSGNVNSWERNLYVNSEEVPENMSFYIWMASELKVFLQESVSLDIPIRVSYDE